MAKYAKKADVTVACCESTAELMAPSRKLSMSDSSIHAEVWLEPVIRRIQGHVLFRFLSDEHDVEAHNLIGVIVIVVSCFDAMQEHMNTINPNERMLWTQTIANNQKHII